MLGCPYCAVGSEVGIQEDGIREKVREVLAYDGPMVCAVDVPPDLPTAPRVASSVRPDGRIVSDPMEDMSPKLSREEFRANMIVPPVEAD